MGLTLKAREMSSMSTSMFEAHSATKATWASGTNCRRPISAWIADQNLTGCGVDLFGRNLQTVV